VIGGTQLVAVQVKPVARLVQIGRIAVDQFAACEGMAGQAAERIAVDQCAGSLTRTRTFSPSD
jgi:hypothetical protein